MNKGVFYPNRIRILFAMVTSVDIDLQWGKMKNGIYCYLTAGILTKVLQKFSLSSPVIPQILRLSWAKFIRKNGKQMSRAMRKCVLRHMQTTKAQISLLISAV